MEHRKKRKGHVEVPKELTRSRLLSLSDKAVWTVLQSYNFFNTKNGLRKDMVFPSYATIAAEACVSKRQAQKSVDRLIEVGLVRKSQNRNSGGGGLTANTYELLPFEESEVAKASPIETLT